MRNLQVHRLELSFLFSFCARVYRRSMEHNFRSILPTARIRLADEGSSKLARPPILPTMGRHTRSS